MNGIEKITARIETDARAEAEKLLSEGQERAAAVRAEYQAKAEAEAKAAAQTGREAAQRQAQRLESAAHMEAKKRMLAAKQECLDAAFEQAKKKLLALPDDQYADLLARMAVRAAKTGREEIILNAKDRERVGAQVAAKANALLAEAAAPPPPRRDSSRVSVSPAPSASSPKSCRDSSFLSRSLSARQKSSLPSPSSWRRT